MFHETKLVHLWAEMTGRIDGTTTVAADPPPLSDNLVSVLTERAHLLAGCTEACGWRLLCLILLDTLDDQDNHIPLGIIADPHLRDSKLGLKWLLQPHIAYQNGILSRGEERVLLGKIAQKLIDSLRQCLNLLFLSRE